MGHCYVLINETAGDPSALAAQVTPAWLTRCAAAIAKQLQTDVAAAWPDAQGASLRAGASSTDIGVGEVAFAIVSSFPNAPGDVAYHDVNGNAVPVAFLALDTCSTLDDASTAISHECCETEGDPECNLWADDGGGHEWARELCDAVESSTYPVDLGDGGAPIAVSDFVLPSFFAPGAPSPYSHLGGPSAPLSTAKGGYQIQRTSGGAETQVTGAIHPSKLARKRSWSSRTYRRGVRV